MKRLLVCLFAMPAYAADYPFMLDTKSFPDGQHVLTSQACDAAGNCTMSAPITITIDNTPPEVSLTADPPKSGRITIHGLTNDVTSACQYTLAIDTRIVSSGVCGTLTYNWQTKHVPKGQHAVVLTATDLAGNKTTKTATVTL